MRTDLSRDFYSGIIFSVIHTNNQASQSSVITKIMRHNQLRLMRALSVFFTFFTWNLIIMLVLNTF